jgi:hypothetical protein
VPGHTVKLRRVASLASTSQTRLSRSAYTIRRPVPEPSGTAGVADCLGVGLASAVAETEGRGDTAAVGCGPWSACTPSAVTTTTAPAVRPVTQAHEGSRAGTGTHLLSYDNPPIIVL